MTWVLKGGAWQYNFDPLIIEAYDGMRKVSDYKLDRMRIWVRILDVPTNWRTELVVKALCANLGTLLQIDLEENMGNYVRVRVALPVAKPLETVVAMTAKLKEKKTQVEFNIQYEKLLDFCYICGYLGHKEKSCGRKKKGEAPSGKFSGMLRCSPPRRFTRQSGKVRAKTNKMAFRELDFSSSSTASSMGGRRSQGSRHGENTGGQKVQVEHSTGNPAIDEMLVEQMRAMKGSDGGAQSGGKQGNGDSKHFGGSSRLQGGAHSHPRSSDLIPALRNLS